MSDILGEIDSKKDSSSLSTTLTASRKISKDNQEKELVKKYMQSFNKPAAKTKDEDDVKPPEFVAKVQN